MNSLTELSPEILSYGAGGLTCKEYGGEEIYALIWCWQHKCGVGKIKNNSRLIASKC